MSSCPTLNAALGIDWWFVTDLGNSYMDRMLFDALERLFRGCMSGRCPYIRMRFDENGARLGSEVCSVEIERADWKSVVLSVNPVIEAR